MNKEREAFEVWFNKQTINAVPDADLSLQRLWASLAWQAQAEKAQAVPEGFVLVPKEPTQEMLDSARDWSTKKYGKAVGNDGASGCYTAMVSSCEP